MFLLSNITEFAFFRSHSGYIPESSPLLSTRYVPPLPRKNNTPFQRSHTSNVLPSPDRTWPNSSYRRRRRRWTSGWVEGTLNIFPAKTKDATPATCSRYNLRLHVISPPRPGAPRERVSGRWGHWLSRCCEVSLYVIRNFPPVTWAIEKKKRFNYPPPPTHTPGHSKLWWTDAGGSQQRVFIELSFPRLNCIYL